MHSLKTIILIFIIQLIIKLIDEYEKKYLYILNSLLYCIYGRHSFK